MEEIPSPVRDSKFTDRVVVVKKKFEAICHWTDFPRRLNDAVLQNHYLLRLPEAFFTNLNACVIFNNSFIYFYAVSINEVSAFICRGGRASTTPAYN